MCVFPLSGFSTISRDITVTSMRFLHAEQGNVSDAFSVFSHIFLQSILEMRLSQNCVSSPGGISEQTHENLCRYSNKTYEVVVIYMNKQQIVYPGLHFST